MRAAAQGSVSQTSPEESASETGAEKHMEPGLRFEEGAEGLAGSATARSQTRGIGMTQSTRLRRWREGKVRPIPGNPPHDRLLSRVISSSLKESLRRSLLRHSVPLFLIRRRPVCVLKGMAESIWSDVVSKSKPKTKPWGGAVPPPAGRPRAQVAERAGRITLHLIVRR